MLLLGIDRIVTMDRNRRVLVDGAIRIENGVISAIGPPSDLLAAHPADQRFDCAGGWVTPGYVNAHQHLTGDRLARCCIPDDIRSGDAIFSWAVPLHAAHTGEDDEISATASCLESLRNGVTTVIEAGTVAHPDRVAAAMSATGIRGGIGRWGWDIEQGPFAAPAPEVLARLADLLDRYPTGGLVEAWVTLVGHDLMSDALAAGAADLARERGARLTFHLSPSTSDPIQYLARTGTRPILHLDHLGVLGPHVLVAHGVHLDDAEIDTVLRTGTAIASCPWAYVRLAQGVTGAGRHAEIVRRGGRVALGCDSENAGDQIDVLRAAALFAGIAKDTSMDPTAVGAAEVFALATIAGAEAVGLADRIGSIEVGKRADLVVHDTTGPTWTPPGGDPYLQLVWGTDGRSVRDVFVDGELVVRDRRSTRIDEPALRTRAIAAGLALRTRAGVG